VLSSDGKNFGYFFFVVNFQNCFRVQSVKTCVCAVSKCADGIRNLSVFGNDGFNFLQKCGISTVFESLAIYVVVYTLLIRCHLFFHRNSAKQILNNLLLPTLLHNLTFLHCLSCSLLLAVQPRKYFSCKFIRTRVTLFIHNLSYVFSQATYCSFRHP